MADMVLFCLLMSAIYSVGAMVVEKSVKPMRFFSWAWIAIALVYVVLG